MSLKAKDEQCAVSRRIVEAVADESDTDPTELEPLYQSIDPDCVDQLFSDRSQGRASPTQTRLRLTFRYEGYRVRLSSDQSIDITPIEAHAPGMPESQR